MKEIISKKDCCGCHACFNICPQNAISMVDDEKGFKYPIINQDKCINCGLCKKVCPILKNAKIKNEPKVYACYNLNDEERFNSSSGGIFILIAKEIIKRKGIVFGSYLNKEFKVEHTMIENENDLHKLMGSKYVQSTIGSTYIETKKALDENKYVLFTGTPCQIEGLKSYLMKDYDKLYTQDIICHGVPSPLVWEKYKKYRKIIDKEEPEKISFRNKDDGWQLFNMKFTYNKSTYKKNQNNDLFMKVFLNNIILRESCYSCHFKKINRISDITLADYWGINNVNPKFNDNKGTSVVIINSEKGKELFDSIKNKIKYEESDLKYILKYNPSISNSVLINKNRESFFDNINNLEFDKLVKKYTKRPLYKRVLSKCKRIIKKLLRK